MPPCSVIHLDARAPGQAGDDGCQTSAPSDLSAAPHGDHACASNFGRRLVTLRPLNMCQGKKVVAQSQATTLPDRCGTRRSTIDQVVKHSGQEEGKYGKTITAVVRPVCSPARPLDALKTDR